MKYQFILSVLFTLSAGANVFAQSSSTMIPPPEQSMQHAMGGGGGGGGGSQVQSFFDVFFDVTVPTPGEAPPESPSREEEYRDIKINKPNIPGPAGLEVNTFTGGLLHRRNDLWIQGRGLSLDLSFCYNSTTTGIDLGYGRGWTMTYAMTCTPDGDNLVLRRADGRKDVYTLQGGIYIPPKGVFDSLVQYQPGKYKLIAKNRVTSFFDEITHHRLTSIVDPDGNTITISYTGSLPTTITDPTGRVLTLTYVDGHLTQVTDPNMSPARMITFINDVDGNPVMVINELGDTLRYAYDAVSDLIQVKDQMGYSVDITYSNCSQVSGITTPCNSLKIAYDSLLRKTTDSMLVNGIWQVCSRRYDTLGNVVEEYDHRKGYHMQYEYDSMKNLTKRRDAAGAEWLYQYDNRGNMLIETDPLGGQTICTYDPLYNKLSSKREKRGNITYFQYDGHGRLLHILRPLGVSEHFTYNTYGRVLTYTDGKGYVTTYAYNTNGDVSQVTHPDASYKTYTYDPEGKVLTATNERGYTTSYAYDYKRRLARVKNALGDSIKYAYDKRGNLLSVTDELTHVTSYSYDPCSRRYNKTTPAGTSSCTYDQRGNVLSFTNNRGMVTSYAYNDLNQMMTMTNAMSHSRSFQYDAKGNLTLETDFYGNPTNYSYDALNRKTVMTDALSHSTLFYYDANNNLLAVTDANGNTTSRSYDSLNRMVSITHPAGVIEITYDANHNVLTRVDENSHQTTFTYDNRNRRVAITDAMTQSFFDVYDFDGNLTSRTDRNGNTTTYTYDALDRLATETNPAGETITYTYDAASRKVAQTYPSGNTATYSYDAADRMVSHSDNIGLVKSYTYDANSNCLTVTDGNLHSTGYVYDDLDMKLTETDPLGHTSTYTYDHNGRLLSETDRLGHTCSYTYDVLGRRKTMTDAMSNVTTYWYDYVGNLTGLTDDNGNHTEYMYDADNRLVSQLYANGTSKAYTYDGAGNIITRTDNNLYTTAYSYDPLNRLIARNYPGTNDDQYSYDPDGRMLTANNANATILFSYDNTDRLLTENMNGKVTSYSYNMAARKRYVTYPSSRLIEEEYDARYRLTALKEGVSTIAASAYDTGDRLTSRTFGNGIVSTWTYNANDWVTTLAHAGVASVGTFNYTYDYEGKRLTEQKVHHATTSEQYEYSPTNELSSYKIGVLSGGIIPSPSTTRIYNYDGVGNRTVVINNGNITNYVINNVNLYTSIISSGPPVSPSYDANGNLMNDGEHNYQYDYENRLISVDGGLTAAYKYDALGRRIQKVAGGVTTNSFFDGLNIIEERNASNVVQATYVYGSGMDELIHMKRGTTNYYYHTNSLGSIAAVTSNTGAVAERYEYDAYGKPTIYSGIYTPRTVTAIGNAYMFAGRLYDPEIAAYYYRARTYNVAWGRFMQRDPKGIPSYTCPCGCGMRFCYCRGIRRYLNEMAYGDNDPINRLDPLGLSPWGDLKKALKKGVKHLEEEAKKIVDQGKKAGKKVANLAEEARKRAEEEAAKAAGKLKKTTEEVLEKAKQAANTGREVAKYIYDLTQQTTPEEKLEKAKVIYNQAKWWAQQGRETWENFKWYVDYKGDEGIHIYIDVQATGVNVYGYTYPLPDYKIDVEVYW